MEDLVVNRNGVPATAGAPFFVHQYVVNLCVLKGVTSACTNCEPLCFCQFL